MDARSQRLAQNAALFREMNERVEVLAHELASIAPIDFLCECANADCTFRLRLPLSVYAGVRADPQQFVVLPLHHTPEIEDLVVEEDGYWIIRRTGEAGEHGA